MEKDSSGTALTQPGEKLYELDANWKIVQFGAAPLGERNDFHYEGEIKGKVNGQLRGVDYGIMDHDCNVSQHVHETIETTDGNFISVFRQGKAIPTNDGSYRIWGFATFETGSKNYKWLNSTVVAIEGLGNPKTRPNLKITAFLMR